MILTKKALNAINTPKVRIQLAAKLGFTEQWIIKSIDANKVNGILTTVAAVQVIKENTSLKDSEILEQEKKAVA